MTNTDDNFNLVEEKWIPVLWADGRPDRVGIRKALREAGHIRQIAASNPLDNVSLLRFLLAVLMWCKEDAKVEVEKLSANAEDIPQDWLKKLDCHKDRFYLFDPRQPFMQDLAIKREKTNASTELIHDLPSGSALNHFRHTRDCVDGLCPACCALGLVRWPCYATAGTKGRGKSMTACPNGNTPAYAFPVCNNLLQCLGESLARLPMTQGDAPIWMLDSDSRPNSLGPLSGLTWRSRSVLLTKPIENYGDMCSYCGATDGGLVREIRFQPGWKRLSGNPWDADPHLVRVTRKKGKKGATVKALVAYPGPNESVDRPALLWHDLKQGVAESIGANPDISRPHDVVVVGSVQALLKHCETIRVKPSADAATTKLANHTKECSNKVHDLVKATTLNPDRHHSEVHAATILMTPDVETRVRVALDNLAGLNDLKQFLQNIYLPVIEQVLDSTACGSPLRRREAQQRARSALESALRRISASRGERDKDAEDKQGGAR